MELGFKYSAVGNPIGVRAAAITLLGATGKDDPRTYQLISAALTEAVDRRIFNLFASEAEAIVALGDERGLALLQDLGKKPGLSPQLVAALSGYESKLRAKLAPPKPTP